MTDKFRPFDLEKALAGEAVIDKQGRKVEQFHLFKLKNDKHFPLVCVVNGELNFFDQNGCREMREPFLFMAPKVKTYWLNVFYSRGIVRLSGPFDDELYAKQCESDFSGFIKTISFDIEE